MSLYQHSDYRKALRAILDERKRVDDSISFASYAEAIGVQKTFVSKVLGGSAHLSDDQLYLTFEYLKFDEEEASYFRLLYDYARTGLHARKKTVLAEIKKVQEEKRHIKFHTTAEMQKPQTLEDMGAYYLDPLNLIVHAHLGISKYAQNPSLLTGALDLTTQQLMKILDRLKSLGIVNFPGGGGKVTVLKHALHLDIESIYCEPYQQLFRFRSAEQIAKLNPEKRFVYSLTFSGDHQVKIEIQALYMDFMKKVEKLLDSDDSADDVYQINFDLFPWTKTK